MKLNWIKIRFSDRHNESWGRLALLFHHGIIFHPEQTGEYIITEEQAKTLSDNFISWYKSGGGILNP